MGEFGHRLLVPYGGETGESKCCTGIEKRPPYEILLVLWAMGYFLNCNASCQNLSAPSPMHFTILFGAFGVFGANFLVLGVFKKPFFSGRFEGNLQICLSQNCPTQNLHY